MRYIDQLTRHEAPFGKHFALARQRRLVLGPAIQYFSTKLGISLCAGAQLLNRRVSVEIAAGIGPAARCTPEPGERGVTVRRSHA